MEWIGWTFVCALIDDPIRLMHAFIQDVCVCETNPVCRGGGGGGGVKESNFLAGQGRPMCHLNSNKGEKSLPMPPEASSSLMT
jgi:hypothetical protein